MSKLAEQACVPCNTSTPRLGGEDLRRLKADLSPDWHIVNGERLEREYKFKDFREALDFTNKVGEVAESINHHPDICLGWGSVKLTIWTHSIGGLSTNDFGLAARVDKL